MMNLIFTTFYTKKTFDLSCLNSLHMYSNFSLNFMKFLLPVVQPVFFVFSMRKVKLFELVSKVFHFYFGY